MTNELTERDANMIGLMHCLSVSINSADIVRTKMQINKTMPRQSKKRDMNASIRGLITVLSCVRVETPEGKNGNTLIDIFFQDKKQIVDKHSDFLLDNLDISFETYTSFVLVIDVVLKKMSALNSNKKRKNSAFWMYIEKTYLPMRKYYSESTEGTASKIIEQITKLLS